MLLTGKPTKNTLRSLLLCLLIIIFSPGPARPAEYCTVVKVIDGDTLEADCEHHLEKVRLIGVDTPEKFHPEKPVQFFAEEASNFTRKMVESKRVRIESDVEKLDRYGRRLGYIYLPDGTFLNAELVRQGYGFALRHFPFRFLDEFDKLEEEARKNQRGLWQENGLAEFRWLQKNETDSFQVSPAAGDFWVVRYQKYIKTHLDQNGLAAELQELRFKVQELSPRDLEDYLLSRGWRLTSGEETKARAVSWEDAGKYIGSRISVEGKIVIAHNSGKACFLNFHSNWKRYFSVVIFASDFARFPSPPEKAYLGKLVRVTGIVQEYEGRPEMEISGPEQIQILPGAGESPPRK